MNDHDAKNNQDRKVDPSRELTEQEMEQAQGGFNPQPEPPASSYTPPGGSSFLNRFRGTSFGR